MRANEFLTELRNALLDHLKQQFPTWPVYVVQDFLYQQAKTIQDQEQLEDWLQGIKHDYPVRQWHLQKLNITLDIFNNATQQRLLARKGGSANPYSVPKDAERHATQQAMIQQKGVSQEPIIVFDHGDGKLELIEGWHRTIQNLQAYPNGYQGPAWVGYL